MGGIVCYNIITLRVTYQDQDKLVSKWLSRSGATAYFCEVTRKSLPVLIIGFILIYTLKARKK